MNPEHTNAEQIKLIKSGEPYRRLRDPKLLEAVRNGFADLLEDRATDPEEPGEANERLFSFAEAIRQNKKILRTPGTLTIFRGVFFGGPLNGCDMTNNEIDRLERNFFE